MSPLMSLQKLDSVRLERRLDQIQGNLKVASWAGHPLKGFRPKLFNSMIKISEIDMAQFEIIGEIEQVEIIARGTSIQDRHRLANLYGEHRRGHWRKKKGVAVIRLSDGTIMRAELHWYEADGIGRKEMKVKYYLYEMC